MNRRTNTGSIALSLGAVICAVLTVSMILFDHASVPDVDSATGTPQPQVDPDHRAVRRTSSEKMLALFLHDQFGVSPATIQSVRDFNSVAEFLDHHIGQSGRTVKKIALDDFVDPGSNGVRPAILTGPHGESAMVTGTFVDDQGQRCLQILESQTHCALETIDRLRSAGFQEAWMATEPPQTEFQFAGSRAAIDHLLISTGLVTPMTDSTARFRISNTGTGRLVIGRIRPSCGCTSISPHDDVELNSGESQEFLVRVASGDGGSFVHQVNLSLFEKRTGDHQRVRILLCGSVQESFSVSPESLNFGTFDLSDRNPATRTIRIQETDSDRFEIKAVESRGPALDFSWHCRRQRNGNSDEYIVKATCLPQQMGPGVFNGEIVVNTTSSRRSQAVIPFRVTVRSNFQAVPGVGAFGMVEPHSELRKQIVLTAHTGTLSSAEIVDAPAWCACSILPGDNEIVVDVVALSETTGYHFGELSLRLTSAVNTEDITIPCSMFVREKKGSG